MNIAKSDFMPFSVGDDGPERAGHFRAQVRRSLQGAQHQSGRGQPGRIGSRRRAGADRPIRSAGQPGGRARLPASPDAPDAALHGARRVCLTMRFAYVRVATVASKLPEAFRAAYRQLAETNKEKIKGLVLDLRFAGGADYEAAAKLADCFLNSERPLLDWQTGFGPGQQEDRRHPGACGHPGQFPHDGRGRGTGSGAARRRSGADPGRHHRRPGEPLQGLPAERRRTNCAWRSRRSA